MAYPSDAVAGNQLTANEFNDYTLNPVYTYGETISALDWLYLKASDGKVYKGAATSQTQVEAFVGFAISSGIANDTKRILGPGHIVTGLPATLTRGEPVYLSDTVGALSTTPGTFPLKVGVALSTSSILIEPFNGKGSINHFGDGSDGALALDGTNTYASILSKSGATYTALRDLFLTNIVFSGSAILDMAGFQLYANGIVSGTGTIRNNGSNGSNGNNTGSDTYNGSAAANGGSAGAAAPGITVPRPAASGNGGRGSYQNGGFAGTAGSNTTISYTTTSGAAGGMGANGGGGAGAGGAGGTVGTVSKWRGKSVQNTTQWFHFAGTAITVIEVTPGSGGGGGGGNPGGSGQPHGSGGGGAGGAGGYLFCAIREIRGTITFEAKGGNGGNGGTASSGTTPRSGGGGGGGNGGIIFLMYVNASGYTTNVSGGTAGVGGSAPGGEVGTSGSAGNSGTVITLQVN